LSRVFLKPLCFAKSTFRLRKRALPFLQIEQYVSFLYVVYLETKQSELAFQRAPNITSGHDLLARRKRHPRLVP
jgi:hypothetical protein